MSKLATNDTGLLVAYLDRTGKPIAWSLPELPDVAATFACGLCTATHRAYARS